jgi:threonine aldolase
MNDCSTPPYNWPFIDLRSDTLTQPSDAMRQTMACAPVGDSFYDEDPSVLELEQTVSTLFQHEAALFVPTGTMSNQIAVQLHCRPGEAVLGAPDLHIFRAESGAIAALGGLQTVSVLTDNDFLPRSDSLEELFVARDSIVSPPTTLLAIENTHLFSGGRIHPLAHLQALSEWCQGKKIATHLDGARLWHAHIETGVPLSEYGRLFQTISVCFSKGLGAPAGSCLIGSKKQIERGKVLRKRLGGTMRQSGILAAGALFALEHHLADLKNDHIKAKKIARWLKKQCPNAEVSSPETNIVLIKFQNTALDILKEFENRFQIKLSMLNQKTLRAVCHRDVSMESIDSLTESASMP